MPIPRAQPVPSQPTVQAEAAVEQLKQRSDIVKALNQTSGKEETPPVDKKQKLFLGTYLVVLLALGAFYYLLSLNLLHVGPRLLGFLQRAAGGAIGIATIITILKTIDVYLIERLQDNAAEYNIRRVLKLIAALLILL